MNKIVQLLQHYGPSLSSDIAAILRQEGKSPEAARQFVSRLPEGVHVLHGLPFPKRARFLYLEKQFPTDRYWNALTTAIDKANPAYSAAIAGVRSRGGCVRLRDFDVVAGSPVKQKGQISGSTVLQRLCSVDLMSKTEIDGLGECVLLAGEIIDSASLGRLRARLLTENVLLDAIRSWAGKMNLASPNTTRIRDDDPAPQFATCRFDLCGPCYLRPVRRFSEQKLIPGFIVADVVVGAQLDKLSVAAFLRKCELLSHLRKTPQFLPMLIADGFTPEALRECRSSGIITTKPDTLFGQDVARALGDLLQTLSNAAAVAAANPDRIEELFRRLSTIEGSAGNLRGALFELVVGHMVRSIEGGSIDIGTLVRSPKSGQCAEIDVRLVKERQVLIYECKGYQPSAVVQKDEIEEWLTKRIPVIHSAHRAENRFSDSAFRYEFWTSGTFHADAAHLLGTAKAATTKYQIDWKDGAAVSAYAMQIKAPGIRKILDEHYFKHPLANIPQLAEVTEDFATPGIN
jgi:hypothetical protein